MLIALRMFANDADCLIGIKCDNESMVSAVHSGAEMLRNIWLTSAFNNIKFKLAHIPGVKKCMR